jgi:hypothetical protein
VEPEASQTGAQRDPPMSASEGETPATPSPGSAPVAVTPSAAPGTPCPGSGEAVDLSFHGSPSSSSPAPRHVKSKEEKGKVVAAVEGGREVRPGGSCPGGAGTTGSFKDALLRPRTFKPRFPERQGWVYCFCVVSSWGQQSHSWPSRWKAAIEFGEFFTGGAQS